MPPKFTPEPGLTAEDRANATSFDETVRSIFTEEELAPVRWRVRLGSLLREARLRQEVDLHIVAVRTGWSEAYLQRMENGLLGDRVLRVETLLDYARAIGCELNFSLLKKDGTVIGEVHSAQLDEPLRALP